MVPTQLWSNLVTEEEDWSEPEDPALHREREEEQPEGGRRHQIHPGELSAQARIFTLSQLIVIISMSTVILWCDMNTHHLFQGVRQVRGGPEQEVASAGGQARTQQGPRLPLRGARGRAQEAVS